MCLYCNFKRDKGEKLIGIEFLKDGRPFYHYTKGYAAINNEPGAKPFKVMYYSKAFTVNVSLI